MKRTCWNGRLIVVALLVAAGVTRPALATTSVAPLPSAAELKHRVLENLKRSRAEQERYVCKIASENDITDRNGRIKERRTKDYELFFVHGQEIDELTAKNGKTLDAGQQKKEMARVEKEIKKDSDAQYVARQQADEEKQLDTLLRMLHFTDGHRIVLNGRSTLTYNLTGDPNVHPHGTDETFLHSMMGTILMDEATGELVDLNARLDHDVKVGAGLLANLHKGLWIHVHQKRYPDGVWLPDLVEGNGDARAAIFFHPYFRFKQRMDGCVRTSVTTSEAAVER